jgi:hypothetical protein
MKASINAAITCDNTANGNANLQESKPSYLPAFEDDDLHPMKLIKGHLSMKLESSFLQIITFCLMPNIQSCLVHLGNQSYLKATTFYLMRCFTPIMRVSGKTKFSKKITEFTSIAKINLVHLTTHLNKEMKRLKSDHPFITSQILKSAELFMKEWEVVLQSEDSNRKSLLEYRYVIKKMAFIFGSNRLRRALLIA